MHPYSALPDRVFWKKFVSDSPWRDLDLNESPKFLLNKEDKVASAGSCFAQHIARYMKRVGLAPYIAEPAHALMTEFGGDTASYTQFSARYGNIYTSRQCLELCLQAFGVRPMIEDFVEQDHRWFDLLRPNVQKDGYLTQQEARADRAYHLDRVKHMFETVDVFIFTLGLTEAWYHASQGHTYPACPGTVRGDYQAEQHLFRNLSVTQVSADLDELLGLLAKVNPRLKIILTVSPVPLVATYTKQNVVVASSFSKAVLRAAAGEVEARNPHVAYFPSYEIISHPASFGQYLASDLREVTERGVAHVMDCFLSSFWGIDGRNGLAVVGVPEAEPSLQPQLAPALADCEEMFNQAP